MANYSDNLSFTSQFQSGFERLRVDVAQTGFYEGREFRSFKELNIAASAQYVIKIIVPINVILFGFNLQIVSGDLRLGVYSGGTPGGVFGEVLNVIPANNMSIGADHRAYGVNTAYSPVVTISAGGTHTGGTELDIMRLKANSNANQSTSVGSTNDERGASANTYYIRLLNLSATDAVEGILKVRWEERP